jgi:hypothetical protein
VQLEIRASVIEGDIVKKSFLITIAMALMLSLAAFSQQSLAQTGKKKSVAEYKDVQQGDVQVHLNGGKDQAIVGATNTLEIWVANGAPLVGMSLGFEIRSVAAFRWMQPYGTVPENNPLIKEEGDGAGKFDFGGLNFRRAEAPGATVDSFLIGGAARNLRFPKHKQPVLCYSLQFRIPAGEKPVAGGFCVDNIYYPPAGSWTLHDGQGFPPTFQGKANSGSGKPDAPPVCFDIVKPPAK